jgi:hypothetical protein
MKSHYMFFCGILKHLHGYHKIRGFKYDVEEKFPSYLPFITLFMCKHG